MTANQLANGGAWNLLGRYAFGASGTVSLTSAAYDTATWSPNVNGSPIDSA